MEKHEFRLGARIVDDDGSHGIRGREAITEPFTIEDKRLKDYQKHYPLYPSDQVWRLEMIFRNGAFHNRLSKECICTVKDFVAILHINSEWLKEVDAHKLVVSASEHWNEVKSVDNLAISLVGGSNLTVIECATGRNFETNNIDRYVNTQPATSSTSIMSPGGTTGVGNLDNTSGQLSSFQYANSMIWEPFDIFSSEPFFHSDDIDMYGNTQPDTSSASTRHLDHTSGQPSSFQGANYLQ